MKWFKHDTNARNDLRLKLLKKRFGVEGYGTYFSLLEIIGEFASKDNVEEWGFVDKLHTTETLAEEIGIDPVKLDEIFIACNELGLFTQKEKRLYCEKILTRLDEYADKLRKQSGQYPDSVVKISSKNKKKNKKKEEEIEEKRLESSSRYLLTIPEQDLEEFTTKFTCTKSQIKQKGEALHDYCKSKGKTYKDYKAFLRGTLSRDFGHRVAVFNGADVIAQKKSEYEDELKEMARSKAI